MNRRHRSTPAGQHRPVLLAEVLAALSPVPGETFVDCTAGFAGHSVEIQRRVQPGGRLFAFDLDPENLPRAEERLAAEGLPYTLKQGNFAGFASALAAEGVTEIDGLIADLGMSSMQVDDAERGFSYSRPGPLDMRMDRSRGRPASELLATMTPDELAKALRDYGDETEALRLAPRIVEAAREGRLTQTSDLTALIIDALGGPKQWKLRSGPNKWTTHPAARTFQALRILVNRELANLEQLLRVLPHVLRPGGRVAIISFHSGEDRLVKAAFREGQRSGLYAEISEDPIRAAFAEKTDNPRSRSAKLRTARRGTNP